MAFVERIRTERGVVTYQSPLLRSIGVPHAFSTRIGGVSHGAFASLNLGNPNGVAEQDTTENIRDNYRLLHEAIGCASRRRVFAHQVHGACVLDPATSPVTDTIHGGQEIGKADAIISTDPSLLLSIRTADCVPVLIAHKSGKQVAAVHAGWRGVVAGVVVETIARFADRTNLCIAIGPHISAAHFEVGNEVAAHFPPDALPSRPPGSKPHVDLQLALLIQLRDLDIPDAHIDTTDRCTVTHADEFFSHRRDHGVTGRMAAVIGARA